MHLKAVECLICGNERCPKELWCNVSKEAKHKNTVLKELITAASSEL